MESNVFLVKWYGPFTDQDKEKEWEKKQDFRCSLYLLHGKLKHAKTNDSYYCGMSKRCVFARLRDKDHHIGEIKNRLESIYVGSISNVEELTTREIRIVEKLITAYLADELDEKKILNETNFNFPADNVYVINEWYKTDKNNEMWKRQPKSAPSNIVPDVLVSHLRDDGYVDLFGSRKLKRL